ncbi:MAG: alpha/beta hydrolase, partial [Longimicrobiales bacterium]
MKFDHIRSVSAIALVLTALSFGGCAGGARPLMPTPVLYRQPGGSELFSNTPAQRRTTELTLLYITNRGLESNPGSPVPYGQSRARSLAFGSAVVELVPDLDWPSLRRQSQLAERTMPVNLKLGSVEELGRFPEEPYALELAPAGVSRSSSVLRRHQETKAGFQAQLQRRLERSPSKEVILYVHGFNQDFAAAAYTTAELCHFFGREDVCAFFTWPASTSGNLLTSYTATTESAEYSVGHLRKMIRTIAETPGVEGIE